MVTLYKGIVREQRGEYRGVLVCLGTTCLKYLPRKVHVPPPRLVLRIKGVDGLGEGMSQ